MMNCRHIVAWLAALTLLVPQTAFAQSSILKAPPAPSPSPGTPAYAPPLTLDPNAVVTCPSVGYDNIKISVPIAYGAGLLPTGRGALTYVFAARGFDKQNQAQGVLSAVQAGAPSQTLSFTMKVSPGANFVLFTVQEGGADGTYVATSYLDFTLNCPFAGSITTVTPH
jgi:hypothetical protein